MNTILEVKSEQYISDTDIAPQEHIASKSAPIKTLSDVIIIKKQVSAPSYLFSLRENQAPPFRKAGKQPRPMVLVGAILSDDDIFTMISAAKGEAELKSYLGNLVVQKGITTNDNLREKAFLVLLMQEAIQYAADRDFDAVQLSCLLNMYLTTHQEFKRGYWAQPSDVWAYFQELVICHSVEDPPDVLEIYDPNESYNILSHFHTIYISNLPLIHILTFGVYRLRFTWPFKKPTDKAVKKTGKDKKSPKDPKRPKSAKSNKPNK
ncbi:uncharacterized protein LOC105381794 isoform X1 [Plutella xylostella]|uniref:uncharacterized protein LOC105381794 isoform X1 n=1 Tax=Plutella xylostella TaxID=51655 RepID=UPI00203294C8|nr:uncharacterized protein LOC105381794 isoform X1 [Plutella xylostella]